MTVLLSGGVGRAAFELREADVAAPFPNPVKLGVLDHREASVFHSRLFSLKDLSVSGFSAASPTRLGGMALRITQFGPPAYREQELILSHGFKVFSGLNAGYSLKGLFLKIDGYGSSAKFALDMGARAEVTQRLYLSLAGMNLNRPAFGDTREPIPLLWTSSLAFKVMPGLTAAFDLEGLGAVSPRLKTGLELELSPSFSLMGGLASSPSRFSGGFRIRRKGISLDYAYRHHPFLSGSHHLGLTFSWAGPASPPGGPAPAEIPAKQTVRKPSPDSKINLLSASEEDFSGLKGIGKFTAQKIIAYRDQNGLKNMDDLLNVPGMTRRVFFLLKDRCVLEAPRP